MYAEIKKDQLPVADVTVKRVHCRECCRRDGCVWCTISTRIIHDFQNVNMDATSDLSTRK
jgi:hypothetical protein